MHFLANVGTQNWKSRYLANATKLANRTNCKKGNCSDIIRAWISRSGIVPQVTHYGYLNILILISSVSYSYNYTFAITSFESIDA